MTHARINHQVDVNFACCVMAAICYLYYYPCCLHYPCYLCYSCFLCYGAVCYTIKYTETNCTESGGASLIIDFDGAIKLLGLQPQKGQTDCVSYWIPHWNFNVCQHQSLPTVTVGIKLQLVKGRRYVRREIIILPVFLILIHIH